MNKTIAQNKIWEYLISHQEELLAKWGSVRFDQIRILENGHHHDTVGKILTQLTSRVSVWLNTVNEYGGYTIYYGDISVSDSNVECNLSNEMPSANEPDYDPMTLHHETFHENNPHNLDDSEIAKKSVDLLMNWIKKYE